ncbi:hypothetical protein [Aestuariivivens sediminicola]|uniref:hypothetical protein n=1 Tax=Aestuariivivens sediminicola TaxID=2913560 RepID=UPI001F562ABC|nr:hypothetical protein [Aestuariivivens sediminicola]
MRTKLSRDEFIKLGGLSLLGVLTPNLTFARSISGLDDAMISDKELIKKFVQNNDIRVADILKTDDLDRVHKLSIFRGLGSEISIMVASLCHNMSQFYKSEAVAKRIDQSLDAMLRVQYDNGTLDAGGNRQSPPDTGFILEYMCASAAVLRSSKNKELQVLEDKFKTFILNAGEAMVTGGVHTPNHRWVVSAALANINALYPHPKYIQRIDQWLAEGVYLNADGHYSERSGVYSAVINKALITMARLLNMPELLEKVSKNLETYYYHTEPNGDVVSVDSRRQDQFMTGTVTKFYLQYRFMAIYKKNPLFAYMVKFIENLPDFEKSVLSRDLVLVMENEMLQQDIAVKPEPITDYEMFFVLSNLARIRRGDTSITLFGGNDKPIRIVSGRSSNPNFLMYRKGDAILKYMRLSTSFFRMGYFSSDGIKKQGNTYILNETKEAHYYQPLEENYLREDGDYELSESLDRRFWNKMDFKSRRISDLKQQHTIIEITEDNGTLDLDFKVEGPPNIEVTIEMCFKEGSHFSGADQDAEGNFLLESDYGIASAGADSIKVGPGKLEHLNVNRLDSEQYTYHQGSLRTDGVHVYITGFTPFHHKMTIE